VRASGERAAAGAAGPGQKHLENFVQENFADSRTQHL